MDTTPIAPPLTVEVVRDLLNQAVAEKGEDYRYPEGKRLRYVELSDGGIPSGPSCLIGNVLHRAGVPLTVLFKYEGKAVDDLVMAMGLASRFVAWGMQVTQEAHDGRETWGQAMQRYENFVAHPEWWGLSKDEVA